jgi:hypothetical protein
MRPPVSAVPSDSPHLTRRPHLTSTTSMGRTARSRSPRSPPTVEAEGKRSLDVKGNALFFAHLRPAYHLVYLP